jgi:hypothetical protein
MMEEVQIGLSDSPCFIGAWFLPDIDLCDKIVQAFDADYFPKKEGEIGQEEFVRIDKNIKNSIDSSLLHRMDLSYEYSKNLQKVLHQYHQKFSYADQVEPYRVDHQNLQKYEKGNCYGGWHSERMGPNRRHLVYMTYLNDVDEGGETEFFYQKLKVKPQKGLTLIWPTDWTHTHRGRPSHTQEKYILTGWFEFLPEQEMREGVKKFKREESLKQINLARGEGSTPLNAVAT